MQVDSIAATASTTGNSYLVDNYKTIYKFNFKGNNTGSYLVHLIASLQIHLIF